MIDLLPPSEDERQLVARCLLTEGVLIGSVDEIWTHHSAWRALGTMRLCVEGIQLLHTGGHSVTASYIKAAVMGTLGTGDAPFALTEMADFLVTDGLARMWWDCRVADDRFPHRCPFCAAAAFIGYNLVTCKSRCPGSRPR